MVAIGSQVTSDVQPYTLVAGSPARMIASLSQKARQKRAEPHPLGEASPANGSGRQEFEQTLQLVTEVICRVVGIHRLDPDENFYDGGVTSIMVLPLLIEIEETFRIAMVQEQFLNAHTPRELSSRIAELISDKAWREG